MNPGKIYKYEADILFPETIKTFLKNYLSCIIVMKHTSSKHISYSLIHSLRKYLLNDKNGRNSATY